MTKNNADSGNNPPPKSVLDPALYDKIWTRYNVTCAFLGQLRGGVPKNPDVIEGWLRARLDIDDDSDLREVVERTQQEMGCSESEAVRKVAHDEESFENWNGFKSDPDRGLYIETRQVRAGLRDSARTLGLFNSKRGSKESFLSVCQVVSRDDLEGDRTKIFLNTDQPTGYMELPVHVMTSQGPRTALKRVDYVSRPVISFEVWLQNPQNGGSKNQQRLDGEDLAIMLCQLQATGLGSDRTQQSGKFVVTEFEKI